MDNKQPPIAINWNVTFFAPLFPFFRPQTQADIIDILMIGAKIDRQEGHYDLYYSDRNHLFNALSLCRKNGLTVIRKGDLRLSNLLYGQDQVTHPQTARLTIFNFVYHGSEAPDRPGIEKQQSPAIINGERTWTDSLIEGQSPYVVNCTNNHDCIPHDQIIAAGYRPMKRPHIHRGPYHYYMYQLAA